MHRAASQKEATVHTVQTKTIEYKGYVAVAEYKARYAEGYWMVDLQAAGFGVGFVTGETFEDLYENFADYVTDYAADLAYDIDGVDVFDPAVVRLQAEQEVEAWADELELERFAV